MMLKFAAPSLTIFLVLSSLSPSLCYDYHDSDYNRFLTNHLESIVDEDPRDYFGHPRIRRDAKDEEDDKCRSRSHFKGCCSSEFTETFFKVTKEQKKDCFKRVYAKHGDGALAAANDPLKCERSRGRRKDMTCFVQCLAEKKNLVDDKGNVDRERLRVFMNDNLKESWLQPRLDDIVTTCLAEASRRDIQTTTQNSTSPGCNPAGIKTTYCLFREIQMNCPQDQIKDKKWCTKFVEKLKKREREIEKQFQNPQTTPRSSTTGQEDPAEDSVEQ